MFHRKWGALLLVVVLVSGCLTGCGKSAGEEETGCEHEWVDATCTEPKTCSLCSETEGSALGHTEGPTFCERCNANLTTWDIGEYTDEFKQPTGEYYAYTKVDGTFTNSATNGSPLTAYVQVSNSGFDFLLYEYKSSLVDGTYSTGNVYSISVLDQNGVKHQFTGAMAHNATKLHLYSSYQEKMLELFSSPGTLKFYLTFEKYGKSTYSFDVDVTGAIGIIYLASTASE